jgi:hypothetical protein
VVLRVAWGVGGVREGDLVAVGIFGHFAGVGETLWVGWLGELVDRVLVLVHVRSVWSGSVAMGEDGGFFAHVGLSDRSTGHGRSVSLLDRFLVFRSTSLSVSLLRCRSELGSLWAAWTCFIFMRSFRWLSRIGWKIVAD